MSHNNTHRCDLYNGFDASNISSTEYNVFTAADVVACTLGLTEGVYVMGSVKKGTLSVAEAEALALGVAMQSLQFNHDIVNCVPET